MRRWFGFENSFTGFMSWKRFVSSVFGSIKELDATDEYDYVLLLIESESSGDENRLVWLVVLGDVFCGFSLGDNGDYESFCLPAFFCIPVLPFYGDSEVGGRVAVFGYPEFDVVIQASRDGNLVDVGQRVMHGDSSLREREKGQPDGCPWE